MNPLTIADFMTPCPLTIGKDQPLSVAHRFMRENRIHHLPVLENGTLVGVVSAGDLHLVETFDGVDPEEVAVEEAMTLEPYVVTPSQRLEPVIRTMRKHRYGSAIVMEGEHVVGVFTVFDALGALENLLTNRPPSPRRPPPAAWRASSG